MNVPFKRPAELATDTATTNDVLLHALDFYETKGFSYDKIILLQPTSPLRQIEHILESISLYREEIDMVVSVRESHAATSICQEDKNGYINLIFNTKAGRSQELKNFYEYNGSIYVINTHSLKNKGMSAFTKKVKYVMLSIYSIDIDNQIDWDIAEFLINKIGSRCTINV